MTLEEAQALLDQTHGARLYPPTRDFPEWLLDYQFGGFWYSHRNGTLEGLFAKMKETVAP